MRQNDFVIIRGGGDLATGVIQKLYRSGMRVLVLECPEPLAVRRTVALCNAVRYGEFTVEDMKAVRIDQLNAARLELCWENNVIPIYIDPEANSCLQLKPIAVVDAILAKRNIGTTHALAPITVGLGPGFCAPKDVDAAIETMRGHQLGRLILDGEPMPNTGTPGVIGGKSSDRVLRAPCDGVVLHHASIGDWLEQDQAVFSVENCVVRAPFSGLLRGLIEENIYVPKGLKCGDVDPRNMDRDACYTISDKARCLGGAVLEAILYLKRQKQLDDFN